MQKDDNCWKGLGQPQKSPRQFRLPGQSEKLEHESPVEEGVNRRLVS